MKKLLFILGIVVLTTVNGLSIEKCLLEKDIVVEPWMTEIFVETDEIKLEPWMTEIFVKKSPDIILEGVAKNGEDFSISLLEEKYYHNQIRYDVYLATYDDYSIKIGSHGKSFILYNGEFIIFYKYENNNFGLYRILFSSPAAQETLNSFEFAKQTYLANQRMNKLENVYIIAENFPLLLKK